MVENSDTPPRAELWARFRFGVVGPLLAAPPRKGELCGRIDALAAVQWKHPVSGEPMSIGRSTIERWYYQILGERRDPLRALGRKLRTDRGKTRRMSPAMRLALAEQYRTNPDWSYRLHTDNLAALARNQPQLGAAPSYPTVLRFMKACGLVRRRRLGPPGSPGGERATVRFEQREVRSYASDHTNALWHLDYHHGSVRVLTGEGQWVYPVLLGILDDHSRLCCHLQWYRAENAANLVHALAQALLKRGLPRALMTDNGSPMMAAEVTQGLERLAIVHETTLPYSPWQNGKQECFWGQIEGRLLKMIRDVPDLTLAALNEATLAWAEMEYNRKLHSELGKPPMQCFLDGPDVGRPAPASDELRLAFTGRLTRSVRRSDATVSVNGRRFEVPSRFAHLPRIQLRMACWDLSRLWMCDPTTGGILARLYPLDRSRNADAVRRRREAPQAAQAIPERQGAQAPAAKMAPLLQSIVGDFRATGLPPAYLPADEPAPRKEP